MNDTVKVLLPSRIFEEAEGNEKQLKHMILQYMKRYPNYTILKVKNGFAVCHMN